MIVMALSALAESTGPEPMRLLDGRSEHCVRELIRNLGATQSRMSRHMQVLRQAGFVVDRHDAQWVRYRIISDLSPSVARLVDAHWPEI